MNIVQKVIYFVAVVVCLPFKPATWRWLLWHDMKVLVYLKGGAKVNVYCEHVNVNLHAGSKSYEFTGMRRGTSTFDPAEIIAIKVIR